MTTKSGSVRPADGLEGIEELLREEREQWKTPGLAVAVIQDGKVILSLGSGLRDVEESLPVTAKTIFPIASVTKSLTVATLAALVRQGKLDWDTPVREYLPDFRLCDQVATERMTPRDLVTHRSGLPRHDRVWYNAPLTRAEIFERLRYLQPSKDFRSVYQYQNMMYMTAGYLAGRLENTTWEQVARRVLLAPLGMKRSSFSIAEMERGDDFARAYEKDDAEMVHRIGYYFNDALGPAGGINSSVEELIRYVGMHLGKGMYRGKTVLLERDVLAMRTPQMVTPDEPLFPELGHSQYGMGFSITHYRGHKMVVHGGNIDGFSSLLSFLPQRNIGVVVLSNRSGSPLPGIVSYQIYDRLLGLEPAPWSARYQRITAQTKAAETAAKDQGLTTRKEGTRPSHPLCAYAGTYEHPAYGAVEIKREGEGDGQSLSIHHNGFSSPLPHFHYDVFETPVNKLNRLEREKVRFETDWNGDIASLRIPFEPEVEDIIFTRVADPKWMERAALEPFAGTYTLAGRTITVALLENNTLQGVFPGQPPYTLKPMQQAARFQVQGLSGFSVEFQRKEDGPVTGMVLYQPNGNFLAERRAS